VSLPLSNETLAGRFFNADSKYMNHKIVNIISLDDERDIAHVTLQRYTIDARATVSTNSKSVFNVEIPYAELEKVFS